MSLPVELHYTIVEALGIPDNADAFALPAGSYHALAQVCLVNRAMAKVAEPLLYKRPCITPGRLGAFGRQVFRENETDVYFPTRRGLMV